jgi:hypothetical protein
MKKVLSMLLIIAILGLSLTACSSKPEHTVSFVEDKRILLLDQYDCVAVFTQYTNGSSETAVPADEVSVKAYQNGVELSPIVPTGDRTEGYIQCDASVQSGTTANVVWIFQLDDSSTVSVELSGGEKVDVSLTEE